jgi:hypothetical protein
LTEVAQHSFGKHVKLSVRSGHKASKSIDGLSNEELSVDSDEHKFTNRLSVKTYYLGMWCTRQASCDFVQIHRSFEGHLIGVAESRSYSDL